MTQHQDCPPVFKKQCFSATPEDSHVLHFNVKVKVAAHLAKFSFTNLLFSKLNTHQLCVLVLILLVGVERSKLGNKS